MEGLNETPSFDTSKAPLAVTVTSSGRSLPVKLKTLVALEPLATYVNCMSVALVVRDGGGGVAELAKVISSNVHLAPSSSVDVYTNAKCTFDSLNAARLIF